MIHRYIQTRVCISVQYADPKMACLIKEGQAIFGAAYCTHNHTYTRSRNSFYNLHIIIFRSSFLVKVLLSDDDETWQKLTLSQGVNRCPKLVRLLTYGSMGHLIGPNIAAWYDFCHIKNLKFPLITPAYAYASINRVRGRDDAYWVSQRVKRGPKKFRLHMGNLIGPNIATWYNFCRIKNQKFPLITRVSINIVRGRDDAYWVLTS